MFPIGSQRALFDIPEGVAYFNTAYNGPLLNASRDRLTAAAGAKSRPWERKPDDFFADAERCRELAGRLFGGGADAWAVIPAASYGVSAGARALEPTLGPGDVILTLGEDFPSNVLPWRRVSAETGADLRTVAAPADGDWTAAVLAAVDGRVRVAALAPLHWTDGALIDLVEVAAACRAAGAAVVVDATQALGAMPVDLPAIDPDFLVAAGYKWLLCPYGFGLMYVAARRRGARPLEETWLVRDNARDFAGLANYSDGYRPGARRFDVGETCVTTVLPGAIAALEQLEAWGLQRIADSLAVVNARIVEDLTRRGFEVPAARAPHLFGARLPEGFRGDLAAELAARDVHVSRRGSSLRFSPHLHVTEADLAQLSAALDAAVARAPA